MEPVKNFSDLTPRRRLRATLVAAALATACAAAPAVAAFSGPYDPSAWTTTLTGTPPGGGWPAGVDPTAAPDTIIVVGGDEVAPGGTDCWDDNLANPRKGCAVLYTISAPASGAVEFAWSYQSYDNSESAFYDVFGYVVDGVQTQLTDSDGAIVQNGTASFVVLAGQTFGFWLDCGDCGYGWADAAVRDFQGPALPEPATLALFGLGLAGLGALARKRAPRRV